MNKILKLALFSFVAFNVVTVNADVKGYVTTAVDKVKAGASWTAGKTKSVASQVADTLVYTNAVDETGTVTGRVFSKTKAALTVAATVAVLYAVYKIRQAQKEAEAEEEDDLVESAA